MRDISSSTVPVPRGGIRLIELEGESLLYNHDQMLTVYLNGSAAVIWQLCDGEHAVGQIADTLTELYPDAAFSIRDDVTATIVHLAREGVLDLSSP